MSGDPYPKQKQLARSERRYHRKVASPAAWQRIIGAKRGPCRVCGADGWGIEYHHLVARIHGGDDTSDNIVPLCRACHGSITRRAPSYARRMIATLTDAEYAYMVQHGGEDYPERAYGVRYTR